jgi:large subunit ribosomal protein L19
MIADAIIKQIKPGAKVRVFEGKAKSPFEGIVLGRKHGIEAGGNFTVRAMIAGVGVEKVLPYASPNITKVEIVSSPKRIHRSKLYFVRKMSGSTIRKRLGVSL